MGSDWRDYKTIKGMRSWDKLTQLTDEQAACAYCILAVPGVGFTTVQRMHRLVPPKYCKLHQEQHDAWLKSDDGILVITHEAERERWRKQPIEYFIENLTTSS